MDGSTPRTFEVNEPTPDPGVEFDPKLAKSYVTYAHRLAARGLVNSSVGGMVIRVPHPDHADGICYAKPQGVSLEEVEAEDLSSLTSRGAASCAVNARRRWAIR